jgi:hypothetical protein
MLDFHSFKDGPGRRKHTDLDHFYSQSKAVSALASSVFAFALISTFELGYHRLLQ